MQRLTFPKYSRQCSTKNFWGSLNKIIWVCWIQHFSFRRSKIGWGRWSKKLWITSRIHVWSSRCKIFCVRWNQHVRSRQGKIIWSRSIYHGQILQDVTSESSFQSAQDVRNENLLEFSWFLNLKSVSCRQDGIDTTILNSSWLHKRKSFKILRVGIVTKASKVVTL